MRKTQLTLPLQSRGWSVLVIQKCGQNIEINGIKHDGNNQVFLSEI